MIHYHGTPIGGTRVDVARFLTGRHALVSFYRPDDIGVVLDCCQSFCLDNGAFSHWKAGKGIIDVESYISWVRKYNKHPNFDWCIIPDKIDGTEADNKRMVAGWLSTARGIDGVPVFHLHESLEYLEFLMQNFKRISLGSSGQWKTPGTEAWWARIDEIMNVLCDSDGVPKCKIHGLRMLNPKIFTQLPLSSADSTNAAVNCGSLKRFGMYTPPTASQRAEVIAARIEQYNSSSVYVSVSQSDMFDKL